MSLDDNIAALRQIEFFASFDEGALRLLAFGGHKTSFKHGNELFHEGQTSDGGYVILSGKIRLETSQENGKSHSEVLGPNSLIGEMALLTRNKRPGTAIAIEDSETLKIRRDVMYRVLNEYPDIAASLHAQIASSVAKIGQQLEVIKYRFPVEGAELPSEDQDI